MGRRGPAPTPTAILARRGSYLANRRINEPMPGAVDMPKKPGGLDKSASKAWKEVSENLHAAGLLTDVDTKTLGRYCELLVRWRECQDFIAEHGMTHPVKDSDGRVLYLKEFPHVGRASRVSDQLLKMEQQFGMTPSARCGIGVDKALAASNNKPTVERFRLAR